jgi:hypothetical protein
VTVIQTLFELTLKESMWYIQQPLCCKWFLGLQCLPIALYMKARVVLEGKRYTWQKRNHWRIGTTSGETVYLRSAEVSLETTR